MSAEVAAARTDAGEKEHADRRDGKRACERDADAVLGDGVPGEVRADTGGNGQRNEREAGVERAPAKHVLEVERAEQEQSEDRAGGDELERESATDGAVGHPTDSQERSVGVALVDGERDQAGDAAEAAEVRLDRGPTGGVCLRDAVDDRGEAGRGECCTGKVEAAPARLLRVGRDELERGDQEDGGDGDVDVEDRAPVGGLGEDAADEDADGGAGSADCSPGGLRLRAGLAVKAGGDDRECRRREESGADALARASGEQGGGTCCHRRHEGRGGEDEESGEEHAAATEKVGGAATEEQEAAEDQRVARDRPADARAAEVAGRWRCAEGRCSRP